MEMVDFIQNLHFTDEVMIFFDLHSPIFVLY